MKRIAVAVLGLAVVFALCAAKAEAQAMKIGYIDMQRALNEVDEGKKAKAQLKKDFDQKQEVLDQKQEELKKLKDDLDKQALVLKEDQKRERVAELQAKFMELQQLYGKLQKELSEREMQLTGEIFKKMKPLIDQIAADGGLSLMLESNEGRILFALPSMDYTNELIRKYNSKPGSAAPAKK